jgi:hypothetical protein
VVRKRAASRFQSRYQKSILKLTEHDATTWAQEERFVRYLERYRTGLLNNQQLQDK